MPRALMWFPKLHPKRGVTAEMITQKNKRIEEIKKLKGKIIMRQIIGQILLLTEGACHSIASIRPTSLTQEKDKDS